MDKIVLTISEIIDLCGFCGIVVDESNPLYRVPDDERETAIVITECPDEGIESDGETKHYNYMAYYDEYPEEGVYPLGEEVKPPRINHDH